MAKNFTPHIKLSQEEVQQELFDFEETINVKASDLGVGEHQIAAEAHVWDDAQARLYGLGQGR